MSDAPSDHNLPDLSILTPEEYAELNRRDIDVVHHLAFSANESLMHIAFADCTVAWILVAGAPGRIVAQGKRNERISDSRIAEIEKHIGKVCFFYSRPDELVEEIPRSEPRFPWAPRHRLGPPRRDPNPLRPNGPFAKSTLSDKDYAVAQEEILSGLCRPGELTGWDPPTR